MLHRTKAVFPRINLLTAVFSSIDPCAKLRG
jgi:hypothetical protein